MSAWTLIVYASTSALEKARCWAISAAESSIDNFPLACTVHDSFQFDPQDLNRADLIALWCDHETPSSFIAEFSDALEEKSRPGVLLVDCDARLFPSSATLVQSVAESPGVVAARLHGMTLRQPDVRRLQHELAISTRCTGGLRGEITRMHDELQLAAMVQKEFLPRELPDVCGVSFAAMWQPASYVSGDIFDVIRLDEDQVGLFLADAVGHGVPAALLTMVICRSLPTRELSGGSIRIVPPAEALARLNEEMIRRQGRTTRFATAVYGVLNCRERVLTIAGAGHPAPLLYRGSGQSEAIETSGGLLGVFDDERFEQVTVELGANDRLLLYSDGFEVAFPSRSGSSRDSKLPTSRYLDEFARIREYADPKEAVESIRRQASRQLGSLHQVDDLTLICVHAQALQAAAALSERTESGLAPAS